MMKKTSLFFATVVLTLACVAANAKSELQQYVEQCESELGFNAGDVQPMDCNDGVPFAGPLAGEQSGLVNDFLIYQRINNDVNLAVACRWLDSTKGNATAAASIELLIHNRANGSTCFFSAKDAGVDPQPVTNPPANRPVSTSIISPTNFGGHPNANDYWLSPTALDQKQLPYGNTNVDPSKITYDYARCVGCHSAGPYIASPRIAQYLALYGLLNNDHDTVADMTKVNHYHAVGSSSYNNPNDSNNASAFKGWDNIVYNNIRHDKDGHPIADCSGSCHSIARNSPIHDLTILGNNATLLPSVQSDISKVLSGDNPVMPPTNDPYSDYRWINRDTPGGSGDWESMHDLQIEYPQFYCGSPAKVEAHAVGSDNIISSDSLAQIPDTLSFFNLREGLVCRNSEQGGGRQCHDYSTRYFCDGAWTQWYNRDSGAGTGDWEQRSHFSLPCESPTAIQASTVVKYDIGIPPAHIYINRTLVFNGPNDRLRYFDTTHGLACVNAEQVDGATCSNYVVRFICQ